MFNLTKHTALNHQPASAKKPQFLQQGMAPFAWRYEQRVPTYAYVHTRAPLVFILIEMYQECALPNPDSFAIAAFVNGISNL